MIIASRPRGSEILGLAYISPTLGGVKGASKASPVKQYRDFRHLKPRMRRRMLLDSPCCFISLLWFTSVYVNLSSFYRNKLEFPE